MVRMNARDTLGLRSVEDVVYEALRDRIIRGEYEPGRRLNRGELAEELGVSTMPVRGALAKLSDEGLVRSLPRRGATVAPLDLAEYLELQDLRIGVESVAARYGVSHMEPHRLDKMKQVHSELDRDQDIDSHLALEWEAYLSLYSAPGRERTINLILEFGRLTERYLRFAMGVELKRDRAIELLGQVIEACERGDADTVVELLVNDLSYDAKRVTEALQQKGER